MTSIAPTQHKYLISKDALLVDMRENLAYRLHAYSSFRQVRVIGYQNSGKMNLLEILTASHARDEPDYYAVNQIAPVYVVLSHKGVEHVLLTAEHAIEHGFGIMGEPFYRKEWHQHDNLKNLGLVSWQFSLLGHQDSGCQNGGKQEDSKMYP